VGGEKPAKPERRQFLRQDGDDPTVGNAARQGFAFGTFTRNRVAPPNDRGTILLIEAAMVDGLPVDVHAYAESHHEFPDVSTGDQFFENADFEAYRMLGEFLAAKALATDKGYRLIKTVEGTLIDGSMLAPSGPESGAPHP